MYALSYFTTKKSQDFITQSSNGAVIHTRCLHRDAEVNQERGWLQRAVTTHITKQVSHKLRLVLSE